MYEAMWFELSEAGKSFLLAMAKDPEMTRQADLAGRLHKASGHVSRYKKRLLQQGVIQERSKGLLEFCLPGFREYFLERIAEVTSFSSLRACAEPSPRNLLTTFGKFSKLFDKLASFRLVLTNGWPSKMARTRRLP